MLATRENVKVVIRFRPANQIEISKENEPECKISPHDKLEYDTINNNILLGKKKTQKQWGYDRVLAPSITQKEVFSLVAEQTCCDVVNGYNGTIFVYGQTGSGKTFTMYGPEGGHGSGQEGLIPRAAKYIFEALRNDEQIETYRLTCSFLEIYQEKSRDLLNKSKKQDLKIRLNKRHETIMQGLMEHEVSSVDDITKLIEIAIANRVQASTNMNATSSRSHMLMRLQIVTKLKDGTIRIGSCNFADLAGSEKVKKTKASGTRLDEAKAINKSLTILGQVILALSKQAKHVPFRDSTLTHILRDSLGGNCKTTLIVAASPHAFNRTETINALRFGRRCKLIQNKASVNKVYSNNELMKKLAILEIQNAKLEEMLKKKAFEQYKNSELPKQIDALKKEIAQLMKRIKELEKENEALNNKMQTLQRRNMELEDKQTGDINKINQLNKEIYKLNSEMDSLRNNVVKDKQDRDAMSSQSQTLMNKLNRVEKEKNELLKNVNKLNIEMEYLNQQKLESQKEKIEMIKKMQNERNEMEAIIKGNEKDIKKLTLENENNLKLLSEKNKLLQEMEKIRQQNIEWGNLNNVLNGEKDKLVADNNELNNVISTVKNSNNKLNEELNKFKNELNDLNQEHMLLKQAQLKLQNENKKLNDENKEMEELLKSERNKFEQNTNQKEIEHNNKLQELRDKFKADLEKQEQELKANHDELINKQQLRLKAEYDTILKDKQEEYKQNMDNQTMELNKKYEQDLQKIKQELLANYTQELNALKKELNDLNQEKMSMQEDQLKLQNENKKLIDENKEMEDLLQKERAKFEQNANEKDMDIYNKHEQMRLKFQTDLKKHEQELKANHEEFIKLKEEQLRSEYDTILKNKEQEYKQNMNDKIDELNKKHDEDLQNMKQELLANYTHELNILKKEINDLKQEQQSLGEHKLRLENENKKLTDNNTEMEALLKSERDKFEQNLNDKDTENNNKLEEMRLKYKSDLKKQQEELDGNHEELIKLKKEQLQSEFDVILANKEQEYKQNMTDTQDTLNKQHEQELQKLKQELLANYNQELKKKEEEFQLKYGELNTKYDDDSKQRDSEYNEKINKLTDEYDKKMTNLKNEFVEQLNKLQTSLNESHERAKNLEIELSDSKMEINKSNELNDSNTIKMQDMQSEMDGLLRKNNELAQLLDKETQKNKEKDDELSRAVNEINTLSESHDKYLFEIDELTRQLEEARLIQDKMREDFARKEELFGAKQKETLNLLRQQQKKVNEYGELISEQDDLLKSKEWQLRSKEEELLLRKRREEQEKHQMMAYLMEKQKSMRAEDEKKAKKRQEQQKKLDEQRKQLLTMTSLPNMDDEKKQQELDISDEEEEEDEDEKELQVIDVDIDSIKDDKNEVIAALSQAKNEKKQAQTSVNALDKNISVVLENDDFIALDSLRKKKKRLLKKIDKCRAVISELQDILSVHLEKEEKLKREALKTKSKSKSKSPQRSSPPIIANSVSIESVISLSTDEKMNESKADKIQPFDNAKKKQFDNMPHYIEIGHRDGIIVKAKFAPHKNAQKINMLLVLFNGHLSNAIIDSLSIEFESNYSGLTTYVKDIKFAKNKSFVQYSDFYQFNVPLVIMSKSAKNISNVNSFNFMTKFMLKTNIIQIKCNVHFNNCLYLYFNGKAKIEKNAFLKQWKTFPKEKIISVNMEKIKYCSNIDKLKQVLRSQNVFLIHHRAISKKGHVLYCSCHIYSTDILMEISVAIAVAKGAVVVKSNDKFISMLCANLIKSITT